MENITVLISSIMGRTADVMIDMSNYYNNLEYEVRREGRKRSTRFEFLRTSQRTNSFIACDIRLSHRMSNIQYQHNQYRNKMRRLITLISTKQKESQLNNEFGIEVDTKYMTVEIDPHTNHWLFDPLYFTGRRFATDTGIPDLED